MWTLKIEIYFNKPTTCFSPAWEVDPLCSNKDFLSIQLKCNWNTFLCKKMQINFSSCLIYLWWSGLKGRAQCPQKWSYTIVVSCVSLTTCWVLTKFRTQRKGTNSSWGMNGHQQQLKDFVVIVVVAKHFIQLFHLISISRTRFIFKILSFSKQFIYVKDLKTGERGKHRFLLSPGSHPQMVATASTEPVWSQKPAARDFHPILPCGWQSPKHFSYPSLLFLGHQQGVIDQKLSSRGMNQCPWGMLEMLAMTFHHATEPDLNIAGSEGLKMNVQLVRIVLFPSQLNSKSCQCRYGGQNLFP